MVYKAVYKKDGKKQEFKFCPYDTNTNPLESARSIIFSDYRDQNGAIPDHRKQSYQIAINTVKIMEGM